MKYKLVRSLNTNMRYTAVEKSNHKVNSFVGYQKSLRQNYPVPDQTYYMLWYFTPLSIWYPEKMKGVNIWPVLFLLCFWHVEYICKTPGCYLLVSTWLIIEFTDWLIPSYEVKEQLELSASTFQDAFPVHCFPCTVADIKVQTGHSKFYC